MSVRRITTGAAATALVAFGAAAPAAQALRAQPAAVGSLATAYVPAPKNCSGGVTTVSTTGALGGRGYSAGKLSVTTTWAKVPFKIKTVTGATSVTLSSTQRRVRLLGIDATTGQLKRIEAIATKRTDGTTAYSGQKAVTLAAGWSGVKHLTYYGPYLYGVTTTGAVKRWTPNASTLLPASPVTVRASGFSGSKGLSIGATYVVGKTSTGKQLLADTLITASTDGTLKELVVPHATPTKPIVDTIKASGWGGFSYVFELSCPQTVDYRYLVGITPTGAAFLYRDKNGYDGVGADISKVGQLGVGWTGRFFD